MSRQICQPVTQVRLTNVAVVRMNRCGKRFELACYRNKIVNYRQGLETDLTEVLQTTRVFTNVSKGEFAPSSALKQAFGTTDEDAVCRIVLREGQIQVSDRERSALLDNALREIATMVSDRCVDPTSDRRYTTRAVLDAMKEAEFCVRPTRPVKRQFLDCVRLLQDKHVLPLARAKMRLCVIVVRGTDDEARLRQTDGLTDVSFTTMDNDDDDQKVRLQCLVDPSLYRIFDQLVKKNDGWRLEILQHCVFEEGEINLENEMERKELMASQQQQDQQRRTPVTSSSTDIRTNDDDEDVSNLIQSRFNNSLRLSDNEDDTLIPPTNGNSRKDNKKAKKKSKKAKRREKEDALERQERQRVEAERQEERASSGRTKQPQPSKEDQVGDGGNKQKSCNTCGGLFTMVEYRCHFRSDWHRYNIKLKMQGVKVPVGEQEFKECDVDAFFDQAL